MFKKLTTLILCFFFPAGLIYWILNLLGHRINRRTKIGFSIIWINETLALSENSKIGNFNYIKVNSLSIDKGGYIGTLNKLNGPIEIELKETAAIGNKNTVYRAPIGVTYDRAYLKLGILSKITSNHRVDCTSSFTMGDYSTIAGNDSQIWTHAYYHDKIGPGRFRLDGAVEIGNNVYIGSGCVINCGLKIVDGIVVGANACVSKSLLVTGTYVSQALRFIESPTNEDPRNKFDKIENFEVCEEVYIRKNQIK